MEDGESLEDELTAQLDEQNAALSGVQELLAADPASEETAALLEELQEGIKETEAALLGLKRQRLLLELDALHEGGAQQQQQQQQSPADDGAGSGAPTAAAAAAAPHLQPGSAAVFRHTDGRFYYGRVQSLGSDSVARLQWLFPTRQFQLESVNVPAAALLPVPDSSSLAPAASQLHAGSRVFAQLPGCLLWAHAEVAEVDAPGQRVVAVTLQDQRRHMLPLASLALAVHAPDLDDGSNLFAGASGYGSGSSSGSEGSVSGSDMEESGSEAEDEEDEWGMGRVSMAMAEAVGLQEAQTVQGPQTETALFFASEGHSRGIGSKLLARMGFKGGGLGRQQQGMQQALHATRLKKGAGLGVDGGKGIAEGAHKRKRSAKQRRQDKAAAAGLEQREAAREAQHELEQQTGSEGLFAVLNSIIGDSSQAQAVKEARLGMGSAGGSSKQGHLFSGGGGGGKKPAAKEEDRRALVQRGDALVALRAKCKQLSEMATRNAKDAVMIPQIRKSLAEARAQLAAAESHHAASTKSITDKEKLKRMAKF